MKNLEKVEKKIKVFSYCFTFETPYWEEDLLRISREEHIFEARNERGSNGGYPKNNRLRYRSLNI